MFVNQLPPVPPVSIVFVRDYSESLCNTEQRLYSDLSPDVWGPPPTSKAEPRHPREETYFSRLYPQSHSFGQLPKMVTDCWRGLEHQSPGKLDAPPSCPTQLLPQVVKRYRQGWYVCYVSIVLFLTIATCWWCAALHWFRLYTFNDYPNLTHNTLKGSRIQLRKSYWPQLTPKSASDKIIIIPVDIFGESRTKCLDWISDDSTGGTSATGETWGPSRYVVRCSCCWLVRSCFESRETTLRSE